MEYRRLGSEDLPSLLELYTQLDESNRSASEEKSEAVWRKIEENDNIRYFGAVQDGRVVSSCYAVIIPNLTRGNRPICFVENVVTDQRYRKRGLASAVMDMAIAFAKEHHCYKVILQSGSARTEAHRFYEGKGFRSDSKKAFDLRLD